MNTKKKNYIEGLDAMRGIAILGVVFYHLIPGKFPGGFLGVNMFFVLSGYLICKGAEWGMKQFGSVRKYQSYLLVVIDEELKQLDWKSR